MTKLKEKRMQKGMSQSQLAEKAGVNLRMLQFYEQGRKSIDQAAAITVCALADALDCNVRDLLETQ